MDNLTIDTGVKSLTINGDPTRVITFNPSDVNFAERFYSIMGSLKKKQEEYQRRSKELETDKVDESGVPVNLPGNLALMRDACEFMRGQVDDLFGPGTSQTVFGDALALDMFAQFFTAITPHIQSTRAEKMKNYLNSEFSGKVMK